MTLLRFIVSCLPAASFLLPAFHFFIAALLLAIASELKRKRWHALVKKTVHSVPEKSSFCTQVLEQSVDIDDRRNDLRPAPVDLLIQRAGRLQRHIRDINGQLKRDGKTSVPPELLILAPVWDDSPATNGLAVPCVTVHLSIPIMDESG